MWTTTLVLLCLLLQCGSAAIALSAGGIALSLDPASLSYSVSVGGVAWFTSRDQGYSYSADGQLFALADKSLHNLTGPVRSAGTDAAGAYESLRIDWARNSSSSPSPEWVTTFKLYSRSSALVFEQSWPSGLSGTRGSSFPVLFQASNGVEQLGALEYTGSSCGFMVAAKGSFPGISGGSGKGYIVLTPRDQQGTGANASVAIGPVTEHFANQARNGGDHLIYGMAPSFSFVPKRYTIETVLTASTLNNGKQPITDGPWASVRPGGVNAALLQYGDFVLQRHNKTRARGDHRIETAYLGYSTTAFYFYNLCDCKDKPAPTAKSGGKPDAHNRQSCSAEGSEIPKRLLQDASTPGVCSSYADSLIAVNAGLKEQGIQVKHFLLDSWWYGEGWNGGAAYWEDIPACTGNDTSQEPDAYPADTFPLGLQAFHKTIGLDKAIWVHNGEWNTVSPYRRAYPFAHNEEHGPPQGRELWDHLFSKNKQWGLGTIKQDHVGSQISKTRSSFTNVSVLKSWMTGMGEAAADNDVGVLYCCAPPNVHMNGVTVPAAYAVRASPDYVWGAGGNAIKLPTVQWAIGPDNAFHWNGLGLLPYKDTFISNSSSTQRSGDWSNDPKDWPSFKGYHETNAATHALMSLLSMAHVTFGDAAGESNKTLLMQLARDDGLLLKADRPATAIDAQFQAMLFNAWPGSDPGPSPDHGSLFTAACDPSNPLQQFAYTGNSTHPGVFKLAALGERQGCIDVSGCSNRIGAAVRVYNNTLGACGSTSVCSGINELWTLAENNDGPGGRRQVTLLSGLSSRSQPLCLEIQGGGGQLVRCDPRAAPQGWFPSTSHPSSQPFSLSTTDHDDAMCLTAALPTSSHSDIKRSGVNGAFAFATEEAQQELAAQLFPPDASLSSGYRAAYTQSAGLMEQISHKQRALNDVCEGEYGSPQGPLGEVYSTHTTVPGAQPASSYTWRYVVGVQLATDFNISVHDLALPPGNQRFVSYRYNDAHTFHPTRAELQPVVGSRVLTLHKSDDESCSTAPRFNITTRCFPFELHAVAPIASNGWVLTGEVGKFIPVSNQRITSVEELSTGGFRVVLKGAPKERVMMGAADMRTNAPAVYEEATIDESGEAILTLQSK